MKKVVIIASSMRKKGNSNTLAETFAKGVIDGGNTAEVVYLYDKNISFCRGCLSCQKTLKCVINDDAVQIAEKMKDADVIAFATPIYYYSVCGQLKTMLDRANPLFSSDYKFRNIYLLATAADEDLNAVNGAKMDIVGWTDCFEKAQLFGVIFAGGVNGIGDIVGHAALEEAYSAGKRV